MCGEEPMVVSGGSRAIATPSSVHRLPCKTASGRRAYLLVRTPYRSSQRGFAVVDCIGRYRSRGPHCLSGATTDQSGECLWLRDTPYLQNRSPPPALITFAP